MYFPYKHGATAWLAVAIFAMGFMGVYAFLMVLARAPGFNLLFSDANFFRTALVTHVVLAVVIFFIAFIMFMVFYLTGGYPTRKYDYYCAGAALFGIILIVTTPVFSVAEPMLNNYIPVLNNNQYIAGVILFFLSVATGSILRAPEMVNSVYGLEKYITIARGTGLILACYTVAMSIVVMLLSFVQASEDPDTVYSRIFYESGTWGGGHLLQFANTLGMMSAWAILTRKLYKDELIGETAARWIFVSMGVLISITPWMYAKYISIHVYNRLQFTWFKAWGLSYGPIIYALAAARKWGTRKVVGGYGFVMLGFALSVWLYALGGVIALMIDGSDTRVPAHYHGVIGAVTIAFMTIGILAMVENQRLNVREKWIKTQLAFYGLGQSLFSIGMFIGGTRGLPRKTFGQEQQLDVLAKKLGMGIMGIGGLLAILAGVVFVVFMIKALTNKTERESYDFPCVIK